MKILSIGNSFSQDAHRYLKALAEANGIELYNINLYIGGCSLERHYNNMLAGEDESAFYSLEECGVQNIRMISMAEALKSEEWDVVTLQQASHKSFSYAEYEPYLAPLAEYVRSLVPSARLAIHKTWAYADGSEKLAGVGYESSDDMYRDLSGAYEKAAESIDAEIFIPAGTTMKKLYDRGLQIHRDTFHASRGLGRYALALTWLKTLFGKSVKAADVALDEPVSRDVLDVIELCANEAVDEIKA